jgi:methionyl-tRNA formyltransferase
MKILFFSVQEADGLSAQLKRLNNLGCDIFRVEEPNAIPPHDDYSLGISDRCNFLIPESFNKITKNGIFNFHPSLLPLHPGSYSQFWSLLFGDPFGVTCHQITNVLDRGPVFDTVPIPYSEDETFQEVYERTRTVTEGMIWRLIGQHENLASKLNAVVAPLSSGKNHTRKTSFPLFEKLPNGWQTKIKSARESLKGLADVNGRRIT